MSANETYEAAPQSSIMSMRMTYSNDGVAMYSPMIQPPVSSSPSQTPTPTYQQQQPTNGVGVGDGFNIVQPSSINVGGSVGGDGSEVMAKKRRGRPRKYEPGEPKPLAVVTPVTPVSDGLSSGKKRGRPRGSMNKQKKKDKLATASAPVAAGITGVGFTPYIIEVKAGEDVLAKLMAFSQQTTSMVCILSANGCISNVTIQQQAISGGTVTYEGRFEILTLCGSFMVTETGGSRSSWLSVSLAGPDGRVLGGGVAGLLTAASPVQIIVGTFMGSVSQNVSKPGQDEALASQTKLPSGTSMGGSLSESSGGAGSGSPLRQSNNNMANMSWR